MPEHTQRVAAPPRSPPKGTSGCGHMPRICAPRRACRGRAHGCGSGPRAPAGTRAHTRMRAQRARLRDFSMSRGFLPWVARVSSWVPGRDFWAFRQFPKKILYTPSQTLCVLRVQSTCAIAHIRSELGVRTLCTSRHKAKRLHHFRTTTRVRVRDSRRELSRYLFPKGYRDTRDSACERTHGSHVCSQVIPPFRGVI